MEILTGHWLSFGAGAFLLLMALYGHYRGFLSIAVTMSALMASILLVRLVTPYVTVFLKENTHIQQKIQEILIESTGAEMLLELDKLPQTHLSAGQQALIEQLKIPSQMKEVLLENNNGEIYRALGVETFLEYISTYFSDMVLNLAGSAVLFFIVYFALRMLIRALNLVSRLPILHGMNQIAGALAGLFQGLIWLWAGCMLVDLCSCMEWTAAVYGQIQNSFWLSFLYQNNFLNGILMGVLRCLV